MSVGNEIKYANVPQKLKPGRDSRQKKRTRYGPFLNLRLLGLAQILFKREVLSRDFSRNIDAYVTNMPRLIGIAG
ncbi:hypothetical protein J14TS5_20460 [Paenibacillus lautus]|nr:hypothetical protein J14TS5_20460 [Paenibacillus lautus]